MKRLIIIILSLGLVAGLLYGIQTALFYFNQEQMLFQSPPVSEEQLAQVHEQEDRIEELILETDDGVTLHGWLQHAEQAEEPSPLLIYFGGNAEELSSTMNQFDALEDWSVLLVNYRGYGLSEGEPSEETLFQDARFLFDAAMERDDIDHDRIAVMGRSMGTAPAVHLSKERDIAGTVLVSPYDSRTHLTEHRHPFMPVQWLIRHPFEISSKAPLISSPLLGIIGTDDTVIPPDHSEVTINAWDGQTETLNLEGYGHNDLQQSPEYWEQIQNFLDEL